MELHDLQSWRSDLHRELLRLRETRAVIDDQISRVLKKTASVESLILLGGGVINSNDQPMESENVINRVQRRLLENGLSTSIEIGKEEQGNSESEGSRKYLTKRWVNFVQDFIEGYGPSTVDVLLRYAPEHLRRDFNAVESDYSSEFRARRLLRRSSEFVVDRYSGLVSLSKPIEWPTPPEMPTEYSGILVKSSRPVDDGSYAFQVAAINAIDTELSLHFSDLHGFLKEKQGWVRTDQGGSEPLSTFQVGGRVHVESFFMGNWTSTFDNIARLTDRDNRPTATTEGYYAY